MTPPGPGARLQVEAEDSRTAAQGALRLPPRIAGPRPVLTVNLAALALTIGIVRLTLVCLYPLFIKKLLLTRTPCS